MNCRIHLGAQWIASLKGPVSGVPNSLSGPCSSPIAVACIPSGAACTAGKKTSVKKPGERGISFEDVLFALQTGDLLDDGIHPNSEKYPGQRLFVVRIDDYAWLVPYVENETELFLKTIIPSRKATREFLRS